MNGLFIVGNKRSGSTHLMRLLNLHEEVFVSNESDVIWILYRFHQGQEIEHYPHDSPSGMIGGLEIARSVLDRSLSPRQNYINYQMKLMKEGFLKNRPTQKSQLSYVGDQKPYQNIDPELLPFVLEMFPEAKFLHILRHPFEVVSSSLKFGNGTGGFIWKGMSPEDILTKWEMHEQWVIEGKRKHGIDLEEVRYDELMKTPQKTMSKVFDFLGLNYDDALLNACAKATISNYKVIDQYHLSASQEELLRSYGMPTRYSYFEAKVRPKVWGLLHRGLRKMERLR